VTLAVSTAISTALDGRNRPVMPDRLNGIRKDSSPALSKMAEQLRTNARSGGGDRRADIAWYGNGDTTYTVTAYYNEQADVAEKFSHLGLARTEKAFGHVQCAYSPAVDRLPEGTFSICLRQGSRGYVELMQLYTDGPLSELAALTNDVWSAQPFAD
jgi:hypothetical protein